MTMHQRWTQADITDLRTRLLAGASVADLVETMQRSPEEIRQMMSRLRLRATTP